MSNKLTMDQIVDRIVEKSDDEDETVYDRRASYPEYPVDKNPFERDDTVSMNLIEEREIRCGFGNWSPEWIQRFATKNSFMIVFTILGVIQGMGWAYFSAIITTLEKRFKISTQTAGIVMTGNELSQILFSIVLSYYGGRGHRPRWIAIGVLLSSLSCFLLASPHVFYGSGEDALMFTKEYMPDAYKHEIVTGRAPTTSTLTSIPQTTQYFNHTEDDNSTSGESIEDLFNLSETLHANESFSTIFMTDEMKLNIEYCNVEVDHVEGLKECGQGGTGSMIPLILIFISQFISGIGTLLFFSLGGPYLDDSMKATHLPMMLGITISLRLLGPALGFIAAYGCLNVYISPQLTPLIDSSDPRWLGAWWLGWLILGFLLAISSFLIAMFPKHLPKAALSKHSVATDTGTNMLSRAGSAILLSTAELKRANPCPSMAEIPKAVRSLLQNRINLFNTLSGVCFLFAGIGYWTYIPKYVETIFRYSSAEASLISGALSITFQATGMLISGAAISVILPSAQQLSMWNAILAVVHIIATLIFTQLGCDPGNLNLGSYNDEKNSYTLDMDCNKDCGCRIGSMLPVCDEETETLYYSACHAGCSSVILDTNSNETLISDCSCLSSNSSVSMGFCPSSSQCQGYFIAFLILTAIVQLLQSSGRIGNMLISYRCVHPQDKSLAIGVSIFLISVFALLPSPILFGTIIDSTCLVWGSTCNNNGKGNCWLYNTKSLRYIFNLTAAGFLLIGGCFDILVWRNVKNLDLYNDRNNVVSSAQKPGFSDDRPRARESSSAYS